MGLDAGSIFDYLQGVDQENRDNKLLRDASLRFGYDYLAAGWLHDMGFCECKFDFMNKSGIGIVDAIESLPESERALAREVYAASEKGKSCGLDIHENLSIMEDVMEEREFSVSCPYVGVMSDGSVGSAVLLGRVDVLRVEHGKLWVVDWKTGDAPKRNDPWNGDVMQVLAYCYILDDMLSDSAFSKVSINGVIHYTQTGQEYSVDFRLRQSVVRPGFSNFRMWSDFTPKGLADSKLLRLWTYWTNQRESDPPMSNNRIAKCRTCEYSHFCSHSL